jgi:hypothetical protein
MSELNREACSRDKRSAARSGCPSRQRADMSLIPIELIWLAVPFIMLMAGLLAAITE